MRYALLQIEFIQELVAICTLIIAMRALNLTVFLSCRTFEEEGGDLCNECTCPGIGICLCSLVSWKNHTHTCIQRPAVAATLPILPCP